METASKQISELFLDLLEQQFRIEEQPYTITLRHASQFADRLNIHVNHLNRSLRETLDKTTTQIISERILREAKHLLRTRNWRVFEIAYTLGFTEATHFNNFFKKRTNVSPTEYRKSMTCPVIHKVSHTNKMRSIGI